MVDNRPSSEKQRNYGIGLENKLKLEHADWKTMNMTEARDRIGMLVTLREIEFPPKTVVGTEETPMAMDDLI